MMCWGSWGNTQKLASKSWRYELFYWDYVIGMVLFTLVVGFTMGSIGSEGRSFLPDLAQADARGVGSVVLGGVIFNASNILLSASVAMAGLSVAFPLGVGLALVLGVVVNYVGAPKGDPVILFLGVALIVAAIVCNGIASQRVQSGGTQRAQFRKGVALAVVAGVLMSLFYRFVAAAMDLDHFENPTPGMLTPLFGGLHLLAGRAGEQLRLQYVGDETPLRRGARRLPRLLQGQLFDPSGRNAGRCDLVSGYDVQLHCGREGRCCGVVCAGTGRADGGGRVGRLRVEGVPRRRTDGQRPAGADVRPLHRGGWGSSSWPAGTDRGAMQKQRPERHRSGRCFDYSHSIVAGGLEEMS